MRQYIGYLDVIDGAHSEQELRACQMIGRVFEVDPHLATSVIIKHYNNGPAHGTGFHLASDYSYSDYRTEATREEIRWKDPILMGYIVRTIRGGMSICSVWMVRDSYTAHHHIQSSPGGHMNTIIDIIQEMAHTITVLSWADYADEHHLNQPGKDYQDFMPKPRSGIAGESLSLADDMYTTIREKWSEQSGRPVQPCDVITTHAMEKTDNEPGRWNIIKHWAHNAVMSCLGAGVRWEDNHESLTTHDIHGVAVELTVKPWHAGAGIPLWEE